MLKKMNTQNNFPQLQQPPKHQSLFTLFCTFDYEKKYFGEHQKWTFRGDEICEHPEKQIEALSNYYYQIKQIEAINKAVIYCNAPTLLPIQTSIVKKWFRGKLQVDNSAFVRYNPNTDFIFSDEFKIFLKKNNLYQDESQEQKFSNFSDSCFFY